MVNMEETVNMSLSGPALSALMYENTRNDHDKEGFLCGKVARTETTIITDAEQSQIRVNYAIKVTNVIPCPRQSYFYSKSGRVDQQKLKSFLGKEMANVVAWYKHKSFRDFKLSLRDKIVHKQLAAIFQSMSELFIVCLSTNERSDVGSTHTFSQRFIRYHKCNFIEVSMHIVNLSNPRDIVRHSAVIDKDNSFNEIVRSVKQTSSGRTGLDISTEIQKMAENGIDALVKKLFSTEMKLFALDQEVTDLFKAIPTVACVEAQENVSFENGENDMENSSGVPTKAKKQRRRGRERKKTVT